MNRSVVILFVTLACLNNQSYGQLVEYKIVPTDPAANSEFGRAVGMSGDYIVVGAGRDNTLGEGAGAAYIFKKGRREWRQQTKLLATDGGELDRMGTAVSITEGYVIVGAFNDRSVIGPGAGSAYIFERGGTSWTQRAKLTAKDGEPYDQFGFSVSISGDYTIVGAFLHDNPYSDAGAAYIFRRDGAEWLEEAKLVASDGGLSDEFGVAVAIDGDCAIVGSPNDDDKGIDAGSVYIFRRNGTEWEQEAKLTASDGTVLDYFGRSLGISGNYVLVGSPYRDESGLNSGAAYLFQKEDSVWIEQAKIVPGDGAANDQFGKSVSLSDNHAVIGAFLDNDKGAKSGSAYIFRHQDETWVQQRKITASDGQSGDWFGLAAAIDSQYAVVGRWSDVDGGAAYVYSGYVSPVSVELSIEAQYDPVPAIGDTFPASLAVTNLTTDTTGVDVWVSLVLPTAGRRHVFGPKTLVLNPSDTTVELVTVRVPAAGPPGVYILEAYWGGPGTFPADTLGSDTCSFSKLAELQLPLSGTKLMTDLGRPFQFDLEQNFPNPFNPSTNIRFEVSEQGFVLLRVYDLLGREIVTLVDEYLDAGSHVVAWDGRNSSSQTVSSGVYIYRLVSGNNVISRKLLFGK